MVDKAAAAAAKAKGNAALGAKDFKAAIEAYTEAIGHDDTDHVFYSNRSAAYASLNDFTNALADGQKCVEINPAFSKGYGRAGAGFHGLGQFDKAVEVYEQGLKVDAGSAVLKEGLTAAKQAAERAANPMAGADNPIAKLFSDPAVYAKLAMDPSTKEFMGQPDFLQKLEMIQKNPAMMQMHMQDPRIQKALGVMLGVGGGGFGGAPGDGGAGGGDDGEAAEDVGSRAAPNFSTIPKPAAAPAPPPRELTEEEKARKEITDKADVEKKIAVGHYQAAGKAGKAKDPEKKKAEITLALEHFNKAAEIDPTNMAYVSNRSACYYELKDYDKAIEESQAAVKLGKEHQGDFTLMAKAYARIGNAYCAKKMYDEAVKAFDDSLLEEYEKKVEQKRTDIKKIRVKAERAAFMDPVKSEECKAKGNEHFKAGEWPEALKAYSEAIERNPKNHLLYSNRCAVFQKLLQFQPALEDCNKCIELEPTFVKIYNRKGHVEFYLKQYHKCTETFQKVIDLAPESQDATEAKEMQGKTQYAIQASMSAPADPEQQARAMEDPEIAAILSDPIIRNFLTDMQGGGDAAQQAQKTMQDPGIAAKINKLIAAGVLKTG